MSYAYGANILAYILGATMLLVVLVTQLAASGRIGRNGFVGIRIPPTMASDAAWTAGHKAALMPSWIGFALVAVTAGVAQFIPGINGVLIAILLLFSAWSVVAAWRGARSAIS